MKEVKDKNFQKDEKKAEQKKQNNRMMTKERIWAIAVAGVDAQHHFQQKSNPGHHRKHSWLNCNGIRKINS